MSRLKKIAFWGAYAVIFVSALSLFNCGDSKSTSTSKSDTSKVSTASKKSKIKDLLSKEPKVKDFTLTDADVLYVAVVDDGTKRNGLASYFCDLLKDEGAKISRVKIVKFGSMNDSNRDNSYGILLGEYWCQ